jgi:hypothetical protein
MKTVFCSKCHKPIKTPRMKLGSKLTVKCQDGHENIVELGGNMNRPEFKMPGMPPRPDMPDIKKEMAKKKWKCWTR